MIKQTWLCPKCDYKYESPVVLNGHGHKCPKKKNEVIFCKVTPDSALPPTKKRVSSSKHKAQKSREDKDMATKRAEPKAAKAAPKKKVKETPPEVTSTPKQGRRSFGPRGWLAREVDKILRKTPDATVPVGEVVKKITNSNGEHPSTGAVSACIQRWGEQGYVKVKRSRPLSFNGYTAKWRNSDFDSFLEAQKEKRAKARAAAKG